MLLATFPELEPADIRSIPASVPGEDLWLSPKAQEVFPFAVECKNIEKLNFWDAIRQTETHGAKSGRDPLLVFRRNGEPLRAVVRLDLFLRLLRRSAIGAVT